MAVMSWLVSQDKSWKCEMIRPPVEDEGDSVVFWTLEMSTNIATGCDVTQPYWGLYRFAEGWRGGF